LIGRLLRVVIVGTRHNFEIVTISPHLLRQLLDLRSEGDPLVVSLLEFFDEALIVLGERDALLKPDTLAGIAPILTPTVRVLDVLKFSSRPICFSRQEMWRHLKWESKWVVATGAIFHVGFSRLLRYRLRGNRWNARPIRLAISNPWRTTSPTEQGISICAAFKIMFGWLFRCAERGR
jgi:hypothetical protein